MSPLQATQAPAGAPTAPPAPPAAPQVPDAPGTGTPVGVKVGDAMIAVDPSRMTAADVAALKTRRSELSTQLNSAVRRRDELLKKMERADEEVAAGMRPQLTVLNDRIVEIEKAIALNGQMMAVAPLSLVPETEVAPEPRFGPFTAGQLTGMSFLAIIGILIPLAIAASRAMLIRARAPKVTPQMLESAARLERMEQAIDAMAVEVERISEGQRFVTQLMAAKEKEREALNP